jgi:hypothetical protein
MKDAVTIVVVHFPRQQGLTPRGKVPMMQVVDALTTNPLLALARFKVEVTNGR